MWDGCFRRRPLWAKTSFLGFRRSSSTHPDHTQHPPPLILSLTRRDRTFVTSRHCAWQSAITTSVHRARQIGSEGPHHPKLHHHCGPGSDARRSFIDRPRAVGGTRRGGRMSKRGMESQGGEDRYGNYGLEGGPSDGPVDKPVMATAAQIAQRR